MDEISSVPVRDDMPADMMRMPSDAEVERRIIAAWGSITKDIPAKCAKCGEYDCFKAFKCKKCNEVFVIETLQDEFMKTCSKCRDSS